MLCTICWPPRQDCGPRATDSIARGLGNPPEQGAREPRAERYQWSLLLRPRNRPVSSDAEVSWLGFVAHGAFPAGSGAQTSGGCRGLAANSCGGSAGLTPDFPVASLE